MQRSELLDSGPLVAYFCPADRYHAWAAKQFATFVAQVTTTEPVLAESCFPLAGAGVPPTRVPAKLAQGVFRIGLGVERDAAAVAVLMQHYTDLPLTLADAGRLRLTETKPGPACTLDREFRVYRRDGRHPLHLIIPDDI